MENTREGKIVQILGPVVDVKISRRGILLLSFQP